MTQQLHPAVERLLHSGKYQLLPRVEGFCEHELKDKNGKVIRKVTKSDLEEFAKTNNQKAANGALTPIGPGHTYDDEYDDKGRLIRKFPEEKQPKPFGYLYNYRVELNPHTNKYSLFHDEYIQKVVEDPENPGRMIDGMQYAASFPRRSAEAYHNEHWIDWMAAIRRAPRLDLGLALYAKANPDNPHILYARHDGADEPVIVMARDKTRYSFDTGGEHMDPAAPDPTTPPSASPEPAAATGGAPTPAMEDLPPEHKQAAEKYAHHMSGMHHTRMKKLMGHLHQKYAAECGMAGDMNTEYAAAGPANVMPAGGAPAAAPAAPAAPAHHTPPKEEPSRMSQDQAAIEKERYERRLADLEARAAAAESKELDGHMRYELQQMVAEGFEINAATELDLMQKEKYSRAQVDNHVAILRRVAPKAPVGSLILDRELQQTRKPIGTEPDPQEKVDRDFDKIQRYMRQNQCSWAEAKEKYSLNGAAH